MKVLIGNTFPLALVRRRVSIVPIRVEDARIIIDDSEGLASFWGHSNTAAAAEAALGVPVRPKVERPALVLDSEGLPSLNGESYSTVLVLSPDYVPGFRPAIGAEVPAESILGWQALVLQWD